jgi:hypothetical protein
MLSTISILLIVQFFFLDSRIPSRYAFPAETFRSVAGMTEERFMSLRAKRSNPEYFFPLLFVSLSLKGLATIFLEQARKRQRTCHAVVSSCRYPRIFNFARALRDSVVSSNNFKQVLTLYPRKIKNTSATQMRGFKDYYLFHCFAIFNGSQ